MNIFGAERDGFLVDPIDAERILDAINDLLDSTADDLLRDILDDACAEIAALLDPSEQLDSDAA